MFDLFDSEGNFMGTLIPRESGCEGCLIAGGIIIFIAIISLAVLQAQLVYFLIMGMLCLILDCIIFYIGRKKLSTSTTCETISGILNYLLLCIPVFIDLWGTDWTQGTSSAFDGLMMNIAGVISWIVCLIYFYLVDAGIVTLVKHALFKDMK